MEFSQSRYNQKDYLHVLESFTSEIGLSVKYLAVSGCLVRSFREDFLQLFLKHIGHVIIKPESWNWATLLSRFIVSLIRLHEILFSTKSLINSHLLCTEYCSGRWSKGSLCGRKSFPCRPAPAWDCVWRGRRSHWPSTSPGPCWVLAWPTCTGRWPWRYRWASPRPDQTELCRSVCWTGSRGGSWRPWRSTRPGSSCRRCCTLWTACLLSTSPWRSHILQLSAKKFNLYNLYLSKKGLPTVREPSAPQVRAPAWMMRAWPRGISRWPAAEWPARRHSQTPPVACGGPSACCSR